MAAGDEDVIGAKLEAEQRWMELVKHLTARLVDATPDVRTTLHLKIASLYQDRFSNIPEAIKAYERVLELEPDHRIAIDHLRAVFEKRRDWERLLELEKGELDRAPPEKQADKAVEIARFAALRVGKPEVTNYWWQRVLDFEPDHAQALAELAKSYERGERWSDLGTVLEHQVEVAPGNDDRIAALKKLAAVHSDRLDDPASSGNAWRRIREIDPDDADAKRALDQHDGPATPTRRPTSSRTVVMIAVVGLALALTMFALLR